MFFFVFFFVLVLLLLLLLLLFSNSNSRGKESRLGKQLIGEHWKPQQKRQKNHREQDSIIVVSATRTQAVIMVGKKQACFYILAYGVLPINNSIVQVMWTVYAPSASLGTEWNQKQQAELSIIGTLNSFSPGLLLTINYFRTSLIECGWSSMKLNWTSISKSDYYVRYGVLYGVY